MSEEDNKDTEFVPHTSTEGQLPGCENGMFIGYYKLDPTETFTMEDMIAILMAMDIRFSHEVFDRLPEQTKKQFVVFNRNMKSEAEAFRYGRTPRGW